MSACVLPTPNSSPRGWRQRPSLRSSGKTPSRKPVGFFEVRNTGEHELFDADGRVRFDFVRDFDRAANQSRVREAEAGPQIWLNFEVRK